MGAPELEKLLDEYFALGCNESVGLANRNMLIEILSGYRKDRSCVACHGPLELSRDHACKRCTMHTQLSLFERMLLDLVRAHYGSWRGLETWTRERIAEWEGLVEEVRQCRE